MALDPFAGFTRDLTSPATRHFAITPDDDADVDPRPRALYVLTDGDLAVRDATGTDITYPVVAGMVIPFSAIRVLATGTTATVAGWL